MSSRGQSTKGTEPTCKKVKRALSIIRVSDPSQRYGYGPDSQWEDDILENAPALGLYVSEELRREIQEPASGWDRVKFTEVIEEAIALYDRGEIEAVIFPRIDRETRFVFSSMPLLTNMLRAGIEVYFAREQLHLDPKDPEAVSTYLNKVGQSQAYIETMKINLMLGRRKRARKRGLLPTGGVGLYPYIYHRETGKRSIDLDSYGVIRKMVDWVLIERISLNEVCRRLMAEEIPAPRGGRKWSRATVGRILTNETLTGKTFANKMEATEPRKKIKKGGYAKTARRLLPRDKWILLPDDTTPQVITPEEFEAIQRQLARNRELSPRNQKFSYLLRGHVYCQQCRRKYYGVPERGKRYYRCSGRSSVLAFGNPCHNRGVNADELEEQVWHIVISDILEPGAVVESYRKGGGDDIQLQQWQQQLADCKTMLMQLDTAESRLIRLFEFTPMTDSKFKEENDRIQKRYGETETRMAEIEALISDHRKIELSEQEIRAIVTIIREILIQATHNDTEDFHRKRQILELVGLKVWIDKDSFSLDFKIPSVPARERHIVSTQS